MTRPKKYFAILCIAFVLYGPIVYGEEHTRYVAIIYRHGDRTPVNQYPTDPYRNESLWPVKFGQLTNTGKQQQYALGKWLRTRYNKLVSVKYDPTEIYVRSTNVDRTLMSASVNLAGMYPPVADSIWNAKLSWQPIPVHMLPEKEDEVLSMNRKCPNYNKESYRVKNSPAYKNRLQKYEKLMTYLSENAGFEVQDYDDISDIYSVLKIENLYNFTLPEWAAEVFPGQMAEPAGYSFTTETATPLMARLKIGPFLKEVVQNMAKVMHHHNSMIPYHEVQYEDLNGEPPLKLNMYSAHDLNIGSILNGLGMYDGRCPEYTSTILFELVYDDTTQIHFVQILYRNTTEIVEPILLTIPACGERCPLERFMQIYKDIIPVDWKEECNKKFSLNLKLIIIIELILIISTCICYVYITCKRNSRRRYVDTVDLADYPDCSTLSDDDVSKT